MSKLWLIEGLPGSGKTTFAESLVATTGYTFYSEIDAAHPVDVHDVYWVEAGVETEGDIIDQDGAGRFVRYGPNEHCAGMDVYELPFDIHVDLMVGRWHRFVERVKEADHVYVFECALLQNPFTIGMVAQDVPNEQIEAYVETVAGLLAPLEPTVVYLETADVPTVFREVYGERPIDWQRGFVKYYTARAYAQANGLSGIDGTIRLLTERQRRELNLLARLPLRTIRLVNDEGRSKRSLHYRRERRSVMQTLKQHSDRFWYMDPVAETDRPILGAVVGDTHTLMIDAGNSEAHATLFLDVLAERGIKRPSLVALTHWHWDHIFGLSALTDTVSIASTATKAGIERLLPYAWDDASLAERVEDGREIAFCADAIQIEYGTDQSIRVVLPTITFDETLTLDLGGVHVVLTHVGGDHAADAVVMYVPEEKILFLGDALYANLYAPSWRMTVGETLRLLDVLDQFEAEAYVWSHGSVVTRLDYEKDRDILRDLARFTLDFPGNKEAITAQYERLTGRDADEEVQELISFFVNGSGEET